MTVLQLEEPEFMSQFLHLLYDFGHVTYSF